jgi:recombinational DNA repair ATPase RecF
VILLDEVMAELDLERRADLLAYLGQQEQVLFTTTDLNLFTPEFARPLRCGRYKTGRSSREGTDGMDPILALCSKLP